MRNIQFLEGAPITLDAAEASVIIDVASFRNINISVANPNPTTLTMNVQGAVTKDAPTFGSAASTTNPWDYVQMVDLEDASVLNGDEGLALSGATAQVRQFEINTNGLTWICFRNTAYTGGSVVINGNKSED